MDTRQVAMAIKKITKHKRDTALFFKQKSERQHKVFFKMYSDNCSTEFYKHPRYWQYSPLFIFKN